MAKIYKGSSFRVSERLKVLGMFSFINAALELSCSSALMAQTTFSTPLDTTTDTQTITINGHLDQKRASLDTKTGATTYNFSRKSIETIPGGDNVPLNQLLLQAPGVAQDSFGQIHVRGDHNEVQFRIDGVQLPEGIAVFGQSLMTRFAHSMSLTTGALPSQYGFLQAAVVDIKTKKGHTDPGAEASIYSGARDYFFPSFQYGGETDKWDYYITGDFVHDRVGIENPTSSFNAIHDLSNQYHGLAHVRYTVDEDTRISLIGGISNAEYQIPNRGDRTASYPFLDDIPLSSLDMREHQKQITDFAILSLQKDIGHITLQASVFSRYSSLRYSPDLLRDLPFLGVSQQAARSVWSQGLQTDVAWTVDAEHTVRFGYLTYLERNVSKTASDVYDQKGEDDGGNALYNNIPSTIYSGSGRTGSIYGIYAQDEWVPLRNLTINYGLRFDGVDEYTHEHQVSPRINIVWKPFEKTTFHAGYSRYFTPPPFESVSAYAVNKFAGTSGAAPSVLNNTVRAERDHYFDVGVEQIVISGLRVAFDSYLKLAHNLIDEGQFGSPIILSGFNYRRGQVNGYELSTSYDEGPLSLYGNAAWSRAIGKDITSAQFNFDPDDLAYIRHRWIHLDHDQRWTASAGAAYTFFYKSWHPTRVSFSMVYGSGLRNDGAVPNGVSLPAYATFNLAVVQTFNDIVPLEFFKRTQLRFDVINIFDRTYKLRDGTGVGVGAPQYGLRRTVLAGITQRF